MPMLVPVPLLLLKMLVLTKMLIDGGGETAAAAAVDMPARRFYEHLRARASRIW